MSQTYRRLSLETLPAWLREVPGMTARVGPPESWQAREVSDGNMNAVFVVDGTAGSVCVKQALPHVRLDAAWALPLDRADYEVAWMRLVEPHAGGRIPALYHYDSEQYVIVMEKLAPHIILRQGLIEGRRFERAASDTGRYVAETCFATSDLAEQFERKFERMALFAHNGRILRITVDLILTDPYHDSPRNRWTRPHLDAAAAAVRADTALKIAASRLGHKFLTCTQALIHGDLHSGSVMVTPDDTRVIDGEFALYGPIGFDLGAFVGNLLLAWFAQPRHAVRHGERDAYRAWILAQIPVFWHAFRDRFIQLWETQTTGDAYHPALFAEPAGQTALAAEREWFVGEVFRDLIGYAGLKMIRRLLSYAHVADFETIADPALRASLEAPALRFARRLMVEADTIASPEMLVALVAGTDAAARAA